MAIRALGGQVSYPLSDRVLSDAYMDGLGERPLAEIRAMRSECEEAEVGVSFARRVLQGHHDIVASELRRRETGGDAPDTNALHDLVERLPQILADEGHERSSGPSWRPLDLDPDMPASELLGAIDAAVGGGALTDLDTLGLHEVEAISARLVELERALSQTRHGLHERIDQLKTELTVRYERGEVTVEGLLG